MVDLRRTQLEESFADASLMLMMDEYSQCHGQLLLEEYQASGAVMPEELDHICQEKIKAEQKKSEKDILLRRTARRAAKAAVIAVAGLFLCTNLILSVEALRVPFLNFCFSTRRCFSSLSFPSENTSAYGSDKDAVSFPLRVPKGYSLIAKEHNHDDYAYIYPDSVLFLGYQDPEGHVFSFQTLPATGSFSIDTEDAESTEFLLNGMQAIRIRKEGGEALRTIWVDPERQRMFDVYCNGMTEEDFKTHILDLSAMFMAPEFYAE